VFPVLRFLGFCGGGASESDGLRQVVALLKSGDGRGEDTLAAADFPTALAVEWDVNTTRTLLRIAPMLRMETR
jgi:hypothetical protein